MPRLPDIFIGYGGTGMLVEELLKSWASYLRAHPQYFPETSIRYSLIDSDLTLPENLYPTPRSLPAATSLDLDHIRKSRYQDLIAVETVARTVWNLWKDSPEKVWDVLREWGTESEILALTCREIMRTGISQGRLTTEQLFQKAGDWFLMDKKHQQTSIHLLKAVLPAIQLDYISRKLSVNLKRKDAIVNKIRELALENEAIIEKVSKEGTYNFDKLTYDKQENSSSYYIDRGYLSSLGITSHFRGLELSQYNSPAYFRLIEKARDKKSQLTNHQKPSKDLTKARKYSNRRKRKG